MEEILRLLLIAVLSYIVGSFPTAVVISKKFFGFDIREKGSGNMGSTNAFRLLGWKWGLTVQIIDILKGVVAVVIVAGVIGHSISIPNATIFEDFTLIKFGAGIFAIFGHIWSLFANFKGGKGINTAAGMLVAIAPIDVGVALGIFIIAVLFSGYISLGSILAAFALPSSMVVRYNIFGVPIEDYLLMVYFGIAIFMIVIFTHRSNISRLMKGTENSFSKLKLIKFKK